MVPYDGEIHDYLGEYRVKKPGLPMMFVPTTAGTGAELSNTFVLTDDVKTQDKLSSQSLYAYADLALKGGLDPFLGEPLHCIVFDVIDDGFHGTAADEYFTGAHIL